MEIDEYAIKEGLGDYQTMGDYYEDSLDRLTNYWGDFGRISFENRGLER